MWGARDEFHFAWKRMKGDFILQARVELLGEGVDPHRKLGFIVRSNLDPDSPYADAAVHGDGLTSLQYRRTKGAITEQVISPAKGSDFVQLERKGNTYTMSVARFGAPLTSSRLDDLALGDEVYVGLFLCSHNPDVEERAVFRDVRVIRPAKEGFVPYRDYIGSLLEILDVETGRRQRGLRLPAALRGAQLDARRERAPLQHQRPGPRDPRAASSLRPRYPPDHPDRHRLRQPQQQRPRAVLRRERARHQRPERPGRPVDRVHPARHGAERRGGSRP